VHKGKMMDKSKTHENGYYPKSEDELRFYLKHVIKQLNLSDPTKDDKLFKATNIKKYSRAKGKHGYDSPKDRDVYESKSLSDIMDLPSLIESQFHLDEDEKKQKQIDSLKAYQKRFGGNSSHVKMKRVAINRKIENLEREISGAPRNEEVHIDEISKEKARAYLDKAGPDQDEARKNWTREAKYAGMGKYDPKKQDYMDKEIKRDINRETGIARAKKKLGEDSLDEISHETMSRAAPAIKDDKGKQDGLITMLKHRGDMEGKNKFDDKRMAKAKRRSSNHSEAIKRIIAKTAAKK